jgi:hypothetical protein
MIYRDIEVDCPKCGKTYHDNEYAMENLCRDCINGIAGKEKQEWLKDWRGDLGLEERIRKIESNIYDENNKPRRNTIDNTLY